MNSEQDTADTICANRKYLEICYILFLIRYSIKMDVINTNIKHTSDSAVLIKELVQKQRKNIPSDKKLAYKDLKRIVSYINKSIFSNDSCCLWDGYITHSAKNHKGIYINFYFKKRKMALHRILYINFKDEITDSDFIKFTCDNKGQCCNINHMVKIEYTTKNNKVVTNEEPNNVSSDDNFVIDFN
jgi:hypothetical protein